MATNLAEIRAKVRPRLRDDGQYLSRWADEDVDAAILAALSEFSRDKPRVVTVALTGAGSFDVVLSTVGTSGPPSTQWATGWSTLTGVAYPYAASSRDLPYLDPDSWGVMDLPGGPTLRLAGATPTPSEQVLVSFTRPHEVSAATSTVPAALDEALADLSAAVACEQLAAFFAQATDSSIQADVVDHRGRGSEYRELARVYRSRYWTAVGRGQDGKGTSSGGASTIIDFDRSFGDTARTDYFFKGRRRF